MDSSQHSSLECKISGFLHALKLKRLVHLAYRTIVKVGSRNLYNFWKREKSSQTKVHGILGFDENGKYKSSSYYPINCLIYHEQFLKEEEILEYCLDSILLVELLDKRTDYFKSISSNESKEEQEEFKYFVASILLLHQKNFPCNAHSLNSLHLANKPPSAEDIVEASTTDFGAGAFALLSMINHSCDPNVTRLLNN